MKQPIEQTFQMSCTNLVDVFSHEYNADTFFGDIFELSVSLFHGLRWVSEDIQLLVPPSYREEDDNWLLNQITQFSDSLYKIPLGKDHIDDIVEYCACDIPFRRNLFVFMANNYSQRLRPILEALNCNDGFPQKILDDMWNKAKIPSICVIIAKLESFENILELFTLVATAEDREHLRFRISPLKKPMKPLRMREVNACSKILSTALEIKLTSCLERIGHIVRDDKLFFVVLAFILLKPVRETYPKSDMADFSSKSPIHR
ncbi:hypothetical protein TCAL_16944 [Tigriopus californicus]|uniref:Uncharacterized protein n=1 Tax=Tigriopus californicus TaxID=6832 RepID=A0A553NPM4_TIGCA|nr:hypothetical protein TCAL_16944 [Tigriopus californicus]